MATEDIAEHKSSSSVSIKSGMMMNNNNMISKQSAPSSNISNNIIDDGVDIDLQGIPKFILDLQIVQPTLNIMTCGDVSHGKSTLLAALSGEKTGKHSAEKKGNMTIRLGYTSCKIWKCLICPRPQCYFTTHSDAKFKSIACPSCGEKPNKSYKKYQDGSSKVLLIRHLSFVDVPGHAQLMQTMVSATSVADGCILVIDSSKSCPGKQTAQHMDAINLLGLMKEGQMIIAQNKIDLIDPNKACLSYEEIRKYLQTFGDSKFAYNTPVIPISAQSRLNIDALCNCILNNLPKYSKKLVDQDVNEYGAKQSLKCDDLYMNIIRSFDVNKAKDLITIDDIDKIAGGVLGGAVINGHVSVGQEIEIRPGYIMKKPFKQYKNKIKEKCQSMWTAQPIRTKIKSLKYGKHQAKEGYPGGNVGIQTNIDPSLTKGDGMCGHVVIDSSNSNPPPIFNKFMMSYTFLSDAIGRKSPFKELEEIRVNIGSFKMKAEVIPQEKIKKSSRSRPEIGKTPKGEDYQSVMVILEAPICARIGDEVGICRQNKKKEWAFVGGGIIRKTKNIHIATDHQRLNQQKEETLKQEKKISFIKSWDKQAILELFIANQSFNDETINQYKSKICSYLKEKEITGIKLLEIGRKQFGENLVIYAGEKKIRGAANKAFDRFLKINPTSEEQKEAKMNDDNQNNQSQKPTVNGKHLNGKNKSPSSTKMKVGIQRRDDENLNDNKQAVHIAYQQRNGRKGITTIVGLPSEINFKKLAQKIKKQFNVSATIKDDQERGKVIQTSGDTRREVAEYIVKLNIVEKDQITIRGY